MKRRYKLILIIIIGVILTIIINSINSVNKITFTALGDGVALGNTSYDVVGLSFNDYLKERLDSNNLLETFNNEFSINNITVTELYNYLDNNVDGSRTKIPIKQTIASSDYVTIAIGMDELNNNLSDEIINKYLNNMESLLKDIRVFYKKDIILLSLYKSDKLSKNNVVSINNKLKVICGKYDAYFIDVLGLSLNNKYFLDANSYYLNYLAHKEIAKEIYMIIK